MSHDDELDPVLRQAVTVLREPPRRVLSAGFTERVVNEALASATPSRSRVGVVRRLVEYFARPRIVIQRPAWSFAMAAVICLLSIGGTLWSTRLINTGPGNVMVRFAVKAPGANTVSLAGDFNGWETEDIRLVDPEGDGVWQAVIPLTPGVYQYMFVLNGETWIPDPTGADRIDDGFGQQNSLVRVEDTTHANGGRYRAL